MHTMCNMHTNETARRVLLLCGGRSEEHDVSLASARSVLEAVSGSDRLTVVPLVIGRDGSALGLEASASALGLPGAQSDREVAPPVGVVWSPAEPGAPDRASGPGEADA